MGAGGWGWFEPLGHAALLGRVVVGFPHTLPDWRTKVALGGGLQLSFVKIMASLLPEALASGSWVWTGALLPLCGWVWTRM